MKDGARAVTHHTVPSTTVYVFTEHLSGLGTLKSQSSIPGRRHHRSTAGQVCLRGPIKAGSCRGTASGFIWPVSYKHGWPRRAWVSSGGTHRASLWGSLSGRSIQNAAHTPGFSKCLGGSAYQQDGKKTEEEEGQYLSCLGTE